MKQRQHQKGFTLVELAIVLTIIGLLIGGILKGQQLMQNARVSTTVAQVSAFEAAVTTFRDTYNAIPGDMPGANTRIPNCPSCNPAVATAGNGAVGPNTWTMAAVQHATNIGSGVGPHPETAEVLLFWAELAQSGLLSGITNAGIAVGGAGTPTAFGQAYPASRIGGGFHAGFSSGAAASIGRPGALPVAMTGLVVVLNPSATAAFTSTIGAQVLTPNEAARMDTKTDDGQPESGFTEAYSNSGTSCTSAAAPFTYTEINQAKNCNLIFRLQG